jgi:hypothetical protein
MQTIPDKTWTKVTGRDMSVYQESGAISWIDVRDDKLVFGPAESWAAAHNSGATLDLSDMTPEVAFTVDWT